MVPPKIISAKRAYEVADSLEKKAGYKFGAALDIDNQKYDTKGKDWLGRTKDEAKKDATALFNDSEGDRKNAMRYRSLADKAVKLKLKKNKK